MYCIGARPERALALSFTELAIGGAYSIQRFLSPIRGIGTAFRAERRTVQPSSRPSPIRRYDLGSLISQWKYSHASSKNPRHSGQS